MSNWTYVNGTLTVEIPFQTVIKDRVKDYVVWSISQTKKHGYDITGSEGYAEMYVNTQNLMTMWSSECGNSWSIAHVQIVGSLRDRELECTIDEIKKFLKKLVQFVSIRDVNIRVSDSIHKEILTEHYYSKLYELDDAKLYNMNHEYRSKIFNIQLHNQHRFFDNLLDFRTCANIAEILSRASPTAIDCLLSNFGLDRLLSWDFDEHIVS